MIEKIKSFLKDSENISIGFSEINFFNANNLDEEQVGYSVATNGSSLVTKQYGDWNEDWFVIGNDNLGDPIFIDCSDNNLPVFTSQHGEGNWDATLIANSLDKFKIILADLKILSVDRESPNEIEENPITEKDLKIFFKNLKDNNKGLDIWWWELFLEYED